MLRVHPVTIVKLENDFRSRGTRRHTGRKIADRLLAHHLAHGIDSFPQISFLFVALFHVTVVMYPGFSADLMSLSGDLLKYFGEILNRDTGRKKGCLDFLFLEHIEHSIDTDALAEFPISNNRQVLFGDSIGWKTTAIFLLQGARPAQILRPGFKGDAR